MAPIKTLASLALLALALAAVPQASAARGERVHRQRHRHNHPMRMPDQRPHNQFTREAGPIDPTTDYDGPAMDTVFDELRRTTVVPMFPGPPRPQNTRAAEEGILNDLRRTTVVPMFPGPPRPQNTLADNKNPPFEQFARRTAPLARSSGAGSGGGSKPPPYPPNRQLQLAHNAALAFFLAAVGFFFLSLVWNLYLQVGLARELQAKKTDANAVEAMRLGSAAPFGFRFGATGGDNQGDGGAESEGAVKRGEGGWLRGANANAADESVRA
ncbi:hypothetical protein PV04_03255 [Phialophora macrospora]|uniref:Uncharacterized protein n=1 Tax=Phialophora macrospora TaxID=1851006 RepID=A0A0D2GFT2_9EURO|nr:hypothetical protein PV04_03255 [Phialophora macrospora]